MERKKIGSRDANVERKAGVRFRLRGTFSSSFSSFFEFRFVCEKNSLRHCETKRMIRQTKKQSRMAAVFRRATNIRAGIYDNMGRITRETTTTGFWQSKKRAEKGHHTQNKISLCLIRHPVNSQRQNGIFYIHSRSLPRYVR